MATKAIYLQTQGIQSGGISPVRPVGWLAINTDNIKIVIDAYIGSGDLAEPRENSLIEIIDDRNVFEMTPQTLLEAVRFYQKYGTMGSDVISYKNMFHAVMPDRYKNAQKQRKSGLKF
jgi:hypothetical protein